MFYISGPTGPVCEASLLRLPESAGASIPPKAGTNDSAKIFSGASHTLSEDDHRRSEANYPAWVATHRMISSLGTTPPFGPSIL